MHKQGFFLFNYIDNWIGCDEPWVADKAFVFWKQLLVDLGLTVSIEKLYEPQTMVPCLGININIATGELTKPREKLSDIISTVKLWLGKFNSTKRALQSLVGKVIYKSYTYTTQASA